MLNTQVSLFSLLCQFRRRPARPPRVEPARTKPARAERAEPAPEDDLPRGCGWFDSSHELQHGLLVQERDPDAVAAELPLVHWLELQLSGWRASAPT